MALWDVGLDYLHGTGHGIGSFLNVHEGMLRACECAWVGGCQSGAVLTFRVSKVICIRFGFALPSLVISLKTRVTFSSNQK